MYKGFLDDIDNYSEEPEKFLDVPFVPSDEAVVEAMLNLGGVGSKDVLYDLGSGDGRIVIAAARDRNTRGIGIEIDPLRIADAMEEAGWAGVECLVDFIEEDIFNADFHDATVVTLYLLESVNFELRPRLLSQLRPGSRIISHAFDMGDWLADDWLELGGVNIYKWIVPARVAGTWDWKGADGTKYKIELKQKFQDVSAKAWRNGRQVVTEGASLSGKYLDLTIQGENQNTYDRFILTFDHNRLHSIRAE